MQTTGYQVSGFGCQENDSLNPRVKLHHLLQKCSFFLIKLAAFLARGGAHMKLRQNGTVS
jgi:hypothetical protein